MILPLNTTLNIVYNFTLILKLYFILATIAYCLHYSISIDYHFSI